MIEIGGLLIPAEGCMFRIDSSRGSSNVSNLPVTVTDASIDNMGFSFNGSSSNIAAESLIQTSRVKTIELVVYLDSTTEYILDLDGGSIYIWVNSGTVTATGVMSPTIYVNGSVSSTINSGRFYDIMITTGTAVDCTGINLGNVGANYLTGYVRSASLFDKELSSAEVSDRYNKYTFQGL